MKKIKYLLILLLFVSGCERFRNPILSSPSSATSAVTLQCPQVENHKFPLCRAFVLVTDQNDQPLTSFSMGNFTALESGQPSVTTKVNKVDNVADPLNVVICMDRSGSMYGSATTDANAAAVQFINAVGANDYIMIIDFESDVEIAQDFTNDKNLLTDTINAGVAYGGTALYDSIGVAAEELKKRSGRKFILALTDGYNNSSYHYPDPEDAADAVNKAGVAAYIIGLGSSIDTTSLQYIADSVSGRFYNSPSSAQLSSYFTHTLTLMQNLVEVNFRSRVSSNPRELEIYLNYGSFETSAKRIYGY